MAELRAYVWMVGLGSNGHPIGPRGQHNLHLYPANRGYPPEEENPPGYYNRRRYWTPWNSSSADPKLPLCGPLRSSAKRPRLTDNHWGVHIQCHACAIKAQTLGLQASTLSGLRQADPWNEIPRDLRVTTADPLSGR